MARSAFHFGIKLGVLMVLSVGLLGQVAAVGPKKNAALPAATNACFPTTVALGDISGWHLTDSGFTGVDMVIRDQLSWSRFWYLHTSHLIPPPPMPYIDFQRYVVVAAIQGLQSSGGMPGIYIVGIPPVPIASDAPARPLILVVDDERPGMLDVITNPYHIVTLPCACVPPGVLVWFRHVAPTPNTGVVRGHVYAPADSTDWLPLQGARVRLATSNSTGQVAISGMDGSYFFVNAQPGTYALSVSVPPYAGQTVTITVGANARTYHDFYLTVGPAPEP